MKLLEGGQRKKERPGGKEEKVSERREGKKGDLRSKEERKRKVI